VGVPFGGEGGAVKIVTWVAAVAFAAAGLVGVTPAQTVIIPVGKAVVKVSPGCLARVVNGPYRKTIRTGSTDLPTGRYQVKTRPKGCKAFPRAFRMREGKKVVITVLNDPKFVARKWMATVEGTETVNGVQTARWEGDLFLTMNTPAYTSGTPGFETTVSYRVSSFDGFYAIDTTKDGCTLAANGQLGYEDLLAEGEVAPVWSNPWKGFGYAMTIPFNMDRKWTYTKSCGDPAVVTTEQREVPPLLFTTNAWDALVPVAPLGKGKNPSGVYSTTVGEATYNYSWSFSTWDASEKRLSKPA
jgi:hypothetical protein